MCSPKRFVCWELLLGLRCGGAVDPLRGGMERDLHGSLEAGPQILWNPDSFWFSVPYVCIPNMGIHEIA